MRLCDRCGKEIPRAEKIDHDVMLMSTVMGNLLGISGLDLCGKCREALLEASKPWILDLRRKVQEWIKRR